MKKENNLSLEIQNMETEKVKNLRTLLTNKSPQPKKIGD